MFAIYDPIASKRGFDTDKIYQYCKEKYPSSHVLFSFVPPTTINKHILNINLSRNKSMVLVIFPQHIPHYYENKTFAPTRWTHELNRLYPTMKQNVVHLSHSMFGPAKHADHTPSNSSTTIQHTFFMTLQYNLHYIQNRVKFEVKNLFLDKDSKTVTMTDSQTGKFIIPVAFGNIDINMSHEAEQEAKTTSVSSLTPLIHDELLITVSTRAKKQYFDTYNSFIQSFIKLEQTIDHVQNISAVQVAQHISSILDRLGQKEPVYTEIKKLLETDQAAQNKPFLSTTKENVYPSEKFKHYLYEHKTRVSSSSSYIQTGLDLISYLLLLIHFLFHAQYVRLANTSSDTQNVFLLNARQEPQINQSYNIIIAAVVNDILDKHSAVLYNFCYAFLWSLKHEYLRFKTQQDQFGNTITETLFNAIFPLIPAIPDSGSSQIPVSEFKAFDDKTWEYYLGVYLQANTLGYFIQRICLVPAKYWNHMITKCLSNTAFNFIEKSYVVLRREAFEAAYLKLKRMWLRHIRNTKDGTSWFSVHKVITLKSHVGSKNVFKKVAVKECPEIIRFKFFRKLLSMHNKYNSVKSRVLNNLLTMSFDAFKNKFNLLKTSKDVTKLSTRVSIDAYETIPPDEQISIIPSHLFRDTETKQDITDSDPEILATSHEIPTKMDTLPDEETNETSSTVNALERIKTLARQNLGNIVDDFSDIDSNFDSDNDESTSADFMEIESSDVNENVLYHPHSKQNILDEIQTLLETKVEDLITPFSFLKTSTKQHDLLQLNVELVKNRAFNFVSPGQKDTFGLYLQKHLGHGKQSSENKMPVQHEQFEDGIYILNVNKGFIVGNMSMLCVYEDRDNVDRFEWKNTMIYKLLRYLSDELTLEDFQRKEQRHMVVDEKAFKNTQAQIKRFYTTHTSQKDTTPEHYSFHVTQQDILDADNLHIPYDKRNAWNLSTVDESYDRYDTGIPATVPHSHEYSKVSFESALALALPLPFSSSKEDKVQSSIHSPVYNAHIDALYQPIFAKQFLTSANLKLAVQRNVVSDDRILDPYQCMRTLRQHKYLSYFYNVGRILDEKTLHVLCYQKDVLETQKVVFAFINNIINIFDTSHIVVKQFNVTVKDYLQDHPSTLIQKNIRSSDYGNPACEIIVQFCVNRLHKLWKTFGITARFTDKYLKKTYDTLEFSDFWITVWNQWHALSDALETNIENKTDPTSELKEDRIRIYDGLRVKTQFKSLYPREKNKNTYTKFIEYKESIQYITNYILQWVRLKKPMSKRKRTNFFQGQIFYFIWHMYKKHFNSVMSLQSRIDLRNNITSFFYDEPWIQVHPESIKYIHTSNDHSIFTNLAAMINNTFKLNKKDLIHFNLYHVSQNNMLFNYQRLTNLLMRSVQRFNDGTKSYTVLPTGKNIINLIFQGKLPTFMLIDFIDFGLFQYYKSKIRFHENSLFCHQHNCEDIAAKLYFIQDLSFYLCRFITNNVWFLGSEQLKRIHMNFNTSNELHIIDTVAAEWKRVFRHIYTSNNEFWRFIPNAIKVFLNEHTRVLNILFQIGIDVDFFYYPFENIDFDAFSLQNLRYKVADNEFVVLTKKWFSKKENRFWNKKMLVSPTKEYLVDDLTKEEKKVKPLKQEIVKIHDSSKYHTLSNDQKDIILVQYVFTTKSLEDILMLLSTGSMISKLNMLSMSLLNIDTINRTLVKAFSSISFHSFSQYYVDHHDNLRSEPIAEDHQDFLWYKMLNSGNYFGRNRTIIEDTNENSWSQTLLPKTLLYVKKTMILFRKNMLQISETPSQESDLLILKYVLFESSSLSFRKTVNTQIITELKQILSANNYKKLASNWNINYICGECGTLPDTIPINKVTKCSQCQKLILNKQSQPRKRIKKKLSS